MKSHRIYGIIIILGLILAGEVSIFSITPTVTSVAIHSDDASSVPTDYLFQNTSPLSLEEAEDPTPYVRLKDTFGIPTEFYIRHGIVYFVSDQSQEVLAILGADAASFKGVGHVEYAKDSKNVFSDFSIHFSSNGSWIPGADTDSFKVLTTKEDAASIYAKDNSHIYAWGEILDTDYNSFIVTGTSTAEDVTHKFYGSLASPR
jgi:hypothetical protein